MKTVTVIFDHAIGDPVEIVHANGISVNCSNDIANVLMLPVGGRK